MGQLLVHDADEEGTLNSQLTYNLMLQHPDTSPKAFSIDAASGDIQAMRILQRREQKLYDLTVRVSDPGEARPGQARRRRDTPPFLAFTHGSPALCRRFQHRLQGRHQGH